MHLIVHEVKSAMNLAKIYDVHVTFFVKARSRDSHKNRNQRSNTWSESVRR